MIAKRASFSVIKPRNGALVAITAPPGDRLTILVAHNPQWMVQAEQQLTQLRRALVHWVGRQAAAAERTHLASRAIALRPANHAPECVWDKRLQRTVVFRDRLRAEPLLAADYQRLKQQSLAAAHSGDPDYDDYTRGKTVFIRNAVGNCPSARD